MGTTPDDEAFLAIVGRVLRAKLSAAEAWGRMEVLKAQTKQHLQVSLGLLRRSRQALDGARPERQTGE